MKQSYLMSQLHRCRHVSWYFLHVAIGFCGRPFLPIPISIVLRVQNLIRFLVKYGFLGVGRIPFLLNRLHISPLAQNYRISLVKRFLLDELFLNCYCPVFITLCLLRLALSDGWFDAIQSGIIDIHRRFVFLSDLFVYDVSVFFQRETLVVIDRYLYLGIRRGEFLLIVKFSKVGMG